LSAEPEGSFATLTHARLRAAQGDVNGAVRILRVILEVQPGHDEARALLSEIEGRKAVMHSETVEDPVEAVIAATSGDLRRRFRDALSANEPRPEVVRLRLWLERVQRNRRARHAR